MERQGPPEGKDRDATKEAEAVTAGGKAAQGPDAVPAEGASAQEVEVATAAVDADTDPVDRIRGILSADEFAALIEELRRGTDEEEDQETEREKLDNEGLQLLREGKLGEFNKLRIEQSEWIPNFAGECFDSKSLLNVNLSGAILSHCEFYNCDLSYGRFDYAVLENASFNDVKAFHGAFRGADLSRSEFISSDFSYSDFSKATLDHIDVNGVHFNGVDFSGAHVCRADIHTVSFNGARFSGTDFSYSSFGEAIFLGVDFESADFSYANFSECDLGGVSGLKADNLATANIAEITVDKENAWIVEEALAAIRRGIMVRVSTKVSLEDKKVNK